MACPARGAERDHDAGYRLSPAPDATCKCCPSRTEKCETVPDARSFVWPPQPPCRVSGPEINVHSTSSKSNEFLVPFVAELWDAARRPRCALWENVARGGAV